MDQIARDIRELIDTLNVYTKAYDDGAPVITDGQWDSMYFKLKQLEKETGIIYPDSPTQSIQFDVVTKLSKVKYTTNPMLSLDKTKDKDEVASFVKGQDWFGMFKMDGLSCRLKYEDGHLVKAGTRGNGVKGEDITHNAFVISSIPQTIPTKETVLIDGEIVCDLVTFEKEFSNNYANPRNFAAGSIRQLSAKEAYSRKLSFVAWDLIQGCENIDFNFRRLEQLDEWGFITVPRVGDAETIYDAIDILDEMEEHNLWPIDGYVFKFESKKYGESLGRTEHHFKNAIAYKFYDEEYETKLLNISYDVSRLGILTPVAVFEPLDVDGSVIERASLHNMTIMREILGDTPYYGEPIWVYKANMIIPQISRAEKKDYGDIIAAGGVTVGLGGDYGVTCPICGGQTSIIKSDSGVEVLYCDNEECPGKLAQRIDHFCGKKGLDIKGISRKTIEKLIDWGWINGLGDIFKLDEHKTEWISKAGFGEVSVGKILSAIDESRSGVLLQDFISALGIPLVGKTVGKTIAKEFSSWQEFRDYVDTDDCFFDVFDGIGEEINNSLKDFDYTEADEVSKFLIFSDKEEDQKENNEKVKDLIFVITGKLSRKREDIKKDIEKSGGKVTGSVSSKTNYLICNDKKSTTGKSANAKRLGIQVITEEELMKLIE